MDKYKRFLIAVLGAVVYQQYLDELREKGRWKTKQERFCRYLAFNQSLCKKFGCVTYAMGSSRDKRKVIFVCLPPN